MTPKGGRTAKKQTLTPNNEKQK